MCNFLGLIDNFSDWCVIEGFVNVPFRNADLRIQNLEPSAVVG